jgi:hypothetical protein
VELFTNQASTIVSSGGTTAPSPGTTETWTVMSSSSFPAITTGQQFHVADPATAVSAAELVAVTAVSGATWTVTRGAESTTPVAHTAGFTVQQVICAGFLNGVPQVSGASLASALAPAVVALTDAATIAVNAALGNDFRVTLGGNRTMGAPSNPADGQMIIFELTQDGTGSRTVTWNAAYNFGVTSAPALSTAAGATDQVGFKYNTAKSKWLCTGATLGF